MDSPRITDLSEAAYSLHLTWSDGHQSQFHYRWLRDNCRSPQSRHANGQRLLETANIPADIRPAQVNLTAENRVKIKWAGDAHESGFSPDWLRAHDGALAPAPASPIRHWHAVNLPDRPTYQYPAIVASEVLLSRWLRQVVEYGFASLSTVPLEDGMVTVVAELFGYVRETNYGRHFEVKSVTNPNNLAYTGLALSPHTDNPYRDPVPTLQLLHCLRSGVEGGDSVLVDGFHVAETLRQQSAEQFALLATWPIEFRFADDEVDLRAEAPVIQTGPNQEVTAIRFNNRSAAPFRLPPEVMSAYYDAYQAFARMLDDPAYQYRFKLQPGDLFIVDNRRVLHGRTGFSSSGQRHLQGCYADRDGLYSRLRILEGGFGHG